MANRDAEQMPLSAAYGLGLRCVLRPVLAPLTSDHEVLGSVPAAVRNPALNPCPAEPGSTMPLQTV